MTQKALDELPAAHWQVSTERDRAYLSGLAR
jgi:hypothetical protein